MIAAHAYPTAELLLVPPTKEIVETKTGKEVLLKPAVKIKFETVTPGYPTKRIKTRKYTSGPVRSPGGRLLSRIDTEAEAARIGWDEDDLIETLRKHPSYNQFFIFLDEEKPEDAGEVPGYGPGITSNGDGSYTCTLCDKHFQDTRGIPQHEASNRHIEARKAHEPEQVVVTA